jgi:hypothetical protein
MTVAVRRGGERDRVTFSLSTVTGNGISNLPMTQSRELLRTLPSDPYGTKCSGPFWWRSAIVRKAVRSTAPGVPDFDIVADTKYVFDQIASAAELVTNQGLRAKADRDADDPSTNQ